MNDENVERMKTEHKNSTKLTLEDFSYISGPNDGKIKVGGWSRFFFPEGKGKKSAIGPTELIIMPKAAMLRLRDAFKSNPAHFASTFSGDDSVPANIVDGERGSIGMQYPNNLIKTLIFFLGRS